MSEIINLTPHQITFVVGDERVIVEPSGTLARVKVSSEQIGEFNSIPVMVNRYSEVEGLPEPKEGTIYVVSSLVAQRVPDREDVFIPNGSLRDESGRIVGCTSLARV